MSSQHTDVDDVTVVARPDPQPAPEAGFTGTPEDGVDARLELATLIAGSDSGIEWRSGGRSAPRRACAVVQPAGVERAARPRTGLVDLR